jgi:hypothetical protein
LIDWCRGGNSGDAVDELRELDRLEASVAFARLDSFGTRDKSSIVRSILGLEFEILDMCSVATVVGEELKLQMDASQPIESVSRVRTEEVQVPRFADGVL